MLATITFTPESSSITEEQDEQQEKEKKAVINAPETVTTVHMEYLLLVFLHSMKQQESWLQPEQQGSPNRLLQARRPIE